MAYCKKFIILFLILFLLFFNFSSVFASEVESVDVSVVNGMVISPTRNYFTSSTNGNTAYLPLEQGYIYHISYFGDSTASIHIALSTDIPALNGDYTYLYQLYGGQTYDYLPTSSQYLYLDYSWASTNATVTREKVQGQDSAISDLVDNVGPNAFWGVFGSGLDFVFIIVIVAFGLFIIYKLIKGFSKCKSKI